MPVPHFRLSASSFLNPPPTRKTATPDAIEQRQRAHNSAMDTLASFGHRIREALATLPAASEQWVLGTSSKMANASALLALLSSMAPVLPAVNMTTYRPGAPIAPFPLPPPGASSQSEEIIRQFVDLDRSTEWSLVEKIKFEGDSFEPEGIVRLGDGRYFVSAGEWTVPRSTLTAGPGGAQTASGEGFAHMLVFDGRGKRLADATISEAGAPEYHGGGIDYDGTYILGDTCPVPPGLHRDPRQDQARHPAPGAHPAHRRPHGGGCSRSVNRQHLDPELGGPQCVSVEFELQSRRTPRLHRPSSRDEEPEPLHRLPGLQVSGPLPTLWVPPSHVVLRHNEPLWNDHRRRCSGRHGVHGAPIRGASDHGVGPRHSGDEEPHGRRHRRW